jgi:amino acid transporter
MSQPAHGTETHYRQELDRVLHVLGNVMITVSGVAPTASVFIIAPVAFGLQGSGAFLAFVLAAIIGVGMAFSYAELGALYPVAGGEYSIVSRVLGKGTGFVVFAVLLALTIFIPSAIALGAGQYLAPIWPSVNPHLVGAVIMIVAAILSVFHVRMNAFITGVFLAIELVAVGVLSILGFVHLNQPLSILIHPQVVGASGSMTTVTTSAILMGVAIAIFSYNGYGSAVLFSEETKGSSRNIARAILWALGITVAAELIPVTAALLGAPSLHDLFTSVTPMSYILTSLGGKTVNTVISLLVFLAILNGTLAIILEMGRVLWSSARDRWLPGAANGWIAATHPRYKTPWIATLIVGACGAVLTAVSSIASLVTFTGVILCVMYALVALSAIVSRLRQRDVERPYRMPLWPVPSLVALVGIVVVAAQQTRKDMTIVLAIVVAAVIYYLVYLRPRASTRWVMQQAPKGAAEADGAPPAVVLGPEAEPEASEA